MENYIFTDLAYEACANAKRPALRTREYRSGSKQELRVFEMHVETEEQERCYRRPRGCYLTVTCGQIWCLDGEAFDSLSRVLATELHRLLGGVLPHNQACFTLLVVGLGNAAFTVDAVGPRTVEMMNVTRHVARNAKNDERLFSVAAMAPGVLAETGMEAVEQIKGVVEVIGADAVIAIDALAASHYERLGATVQISDCGICPGSGVGNAKKAITKQTVGVPVLALGVPTVVDAATLICDALIRGGIDKLSPQMETAVSQSRGYFVCPKESDLITQSVSLLLADAMDRLGGIKRGGRAYSEA